MYVFLLIQHAKRMRRIILSSVSSLAQPHVSTLSRKGRDFRENVTEYNMCVLIITATLRIKFLILRRFRRDTIINVHSSLC